MIHNRYSIYVEKLTSSIYDNVQGPETHLELAYRPSTLLGVIKKYQTKTK